MTFEEVLRLDCFVCVKLLIIEFHKWKSLKSFCGLDLSLQSVILDGWTFQESSIALRRIDRNERLHLTEIVDR